MISQNKTKKSRNLVKMCYGPECDLLVEYLFLCCWMNTLQLPMLSSWLKWPWIWLYSLPSRFIQFGYQGVRMSSYRELIPVLLLEVLYNGVNSCISPWNYVHLAYNLISSLHACTLNNLCFLSCISFFLLNVSLSEVYSIWNLKLMLACFN